jgi:DNA repair exonuclease SbcCD ATPase subunit
VLDEARRAARDRYFEPVARELAPLLSMVYGAARIEFDDATLLPSRITRAAVEEGFEDLSGGTREQIAVLTRLAFARLLARDGRPTPVILDDALVFSDDDRIERMFDVLHRQENDVQIIVLTCRQRVFRELGGKILRFAPRGAEKSGGLREAR